MAVAPILIRTLRWGGLLVVAVALVAGGVGWLTAGTSGLLAGLAGALLAGVFLGLTAVSILIAARVTRGRPGDPLFYAIVLGGWLLKMILFLVVAFLLRGGAGLDPMVFLGSALAAVLGSLVVDVVAFRTTRVPYVDEPAADE